MFWANSSSRAQNWWEKTLMMLLLIVTMTATMICICNQINFEKWWHHFSNMMSFTCDLLPSILLEAIWLFSLFWILLINIGGRHHEIQLRTSFVKVVRPMAIYEVLALSKVCYSKQGSMWFYNCLSTLTSSHWTHFFFFWTSHNSWKICPTLEALEGRGGQFLFETL